MHYLIFDRVEDDYLVFDVDGTVSAARQRAVEADCYTRASQNSELLY